MCILNNKEKKNYKLKKKKKSTIANCAWIAHGTQNSWAVILGKSNDKYWHGKYIKVLNFPTKVLSSHMGRTVACATTRIHGNILSSHTLYAHVAPSVAAFPHFILVHVTLKAPTDHHLATWYPPLNYINGFTFGRRKKNRWCLISDARKT